MSHAGKSESPSPEERDWKEEAVDDAGGNMRNLRVFDRQRGVGMESFGDIGDSGSIIE
jgi:hypothetical protein